MALKFPLGQSCTVGGTEVRHTQGQSWRCTHGSKHPTRLLGGEFSPHSPFGPRVRVRGGPAEVAGAASRRESRSCRARPRAAPSPRSCAPSHAGVWNEDELATASTTLGCFATDMPAQVHSQLIAEQLNDTPAQLGSAPARPGVGKPDEPRSDCRVKARWSGHVLDVRQERRWASVSAVPCLLRFREEILILKNYGAWRSAEEKQVYVQVTQDTGMVAAGELTCLPAPQFLFLGVRCFGVWYLFLSFR